MMGSSSAATTGSDDTKVCPRGHWRPGEDEKLRQLVEQYGPQNWNSIAEKLQGRSGVSQELKISSSLLVVFSREDETLLNISIIYIYIYWPVSNFKFVKPCITSS